MRFSPPLGFARLAFFFLAILAVHKPASASQGIIPLSIRTLAAPLNNGPLFTGIPFPLGTMTDTSQLDLVWDGQSQPRQISVISRYPDGSVRVALVGFRATVAAWDTMYAQVRYNSGVGIDLNPAMPWSRNPAVDVFCDPRWYASSGVFNLRFLASDDNALFPPFESHMLSQFAVTSDPVTNTNPDVRNYYDHVHAVYMTLLRSGRSVGAFQRAYDELIQYRDNEVLLSGPYAGQYCAGSYTTNRQPIPFAIVRRMYIQGLLEDYYLTGDQRSLDVAKLMGDAYAVDAYQQGAAFTYTERIPGWEIMGLCSIYEATLDQKYLDAAKYIAQIELAHQAAMALKYPNQGGIIGQTGSFIQDCNNVWFDPEESLVSGAGSPFMTTLLCEGFMRLYWLTGQPEIKQSILDVCDWLADAAFTPFSDPNNPSGADSFWYICIDPANRTVFPPLNVMFLQMLGFAHQATGDPKYFSIANLVLADNSWGGWIKEFNQGMHNSGQGLYLLQTPAGTAPLTLAQSGGIAYYAISGKVTLNGAGLAKVSVAAGTHTATSDSSGNYTIFMVPAGTYSVSASKAGYYFSASQTATVGPDLTGLNFTATALPSISSITFSPSSVAGGNASTATLTMSGAAPISVSVSLSSSNTYVATVPATISIPAGQTTGTFTVNTSTVSANTTATVTATNFASNKSGTLTIKPPAPASVTLSPTTAVGGAAVSGTVTLDAPAPDIGTTVALASANTAVATTPYSVTIPFGLKTGTFTIATKSVTVNTSVSIRATANATTKTATLTVVPLLASLAFSPTSLTGGANSTGTVNLNTAAGVGGIDVALMSSDTIAATVPAIVNVPEGQLSAAFIVTTYPVAVAHTPSITAKLQGASKTATLTVKPPAVSTLTLSPAVVAGGASSTGTVTLTGNAPLGGLTVMLASNSSQAQVPATVTVLEGSKTATFPIGTSAVALKVSSTISVTGGGATKSAILTINPPSFNTLTLTPTSVVGSNSSIGTVTLSSIAPIGGITVTLTSNNSNAQVLPSVTIPEGATSAIFTVTTSQVTIKTSVTISGTALGKTRSATLTINP